MLLFLCKLFFKASTNRNNSIPEFLTTGKYHQKPTIYTISNAMDVGDPSNFIRILSLFDGDFNQLSDVLSAVSVSDEETKIAIMELYKSKNYLLDPHGAVGYLALKNYLDNHPGLKGYFAETAHPVKFFDVVEPIINNKISLPSVIESIINKEKKSTKIEVEYNQLKDYLLTLDM